MKDFDFYGFPKSSQEDWIARVKKDLKGKDFDEALVSQLWGDIQIAPMYFAKDDTVEPMAFHKDSQLPGFSPRIWSNLVAIKVENESSANAEILDLLNSGADGIILQTIGSPDLSRVLRDVKIEYIDIFFQSEGKPEEFQQSLDAFLNTQENPKENLTGGILWSPSSDLIKNGEGAFDFRLAGELISFYGDFPGFYPLTIDFANYAESGGNGLQELTFGLAELIEMLAGLGELEIDPKAVFQNCGFLLAVGSDYFGEIAKLKAARKLIASLTDLYGFALEESEIKLITTSSVFTKSLIDPQSNFIRLTYEGMAGILGGSNALWIKPLDGYQADVLSKRMARNISSILKDEGHLDKVMDPAAGSYFLDQLQRDIESSVQNELFQIENDGGWYSMYQNGSIQKQIRKERLQVQNAVLDQSKIKVGANKYQAPNEDLNSRNFELIEERPLQLKATRATYLLEKETFKK